MKLIIAGSRTFTNYKLAEEEFLKLFEKYKVTEIVSGGAKGADTIGELLALRYNIKLTQFLPDWNKYGKKAGMLRNIEMGDYCNIGLIFWDGKSKGTKHMISYLEKINKPYILIKDK